MDKELNLTGNESGVVSSEAVISAISSVLDGEDKDYNTVSVLLVSDDEIKEVNKKYLGHDQTTDVVTFPLHEKSEPIEGEIYVSLQTTERNSKTYNNSHSNEIIRVVIHGILHLAGYEDSTSESREEMKKKEDFYLNLIEDSLMTKRQ
ncbi:MAG: rRNA maturation RNase YbeY [Candidatus Marinimicrobia bacterium]|nr:rRNA maturation RNase YbeY [Candidatus Neomarinimicrobiota bacterium]